MCVYRERTHAQETYENRVSSESTKDNCICRHEQHLPFDRDE